MVWKKAPLSDAPLKVAEVEMFPVVSEPRLWKSQGPVKLNHPTRNGHPSRYFYNFTIIQKFWFGWSTTTIEEQFRRPVIPESVLQFAFFQRLSGYLDHSVQLHLYIWYSVRLSGSSLRLMQDIFDQYQAQRSRGFKMSGQDIVSLLQIRGRHFNSYNAVEAVSRLFLFSAFLQSDQDGRIPRSATIDSDRIIRHLANTESIIIALQDTEFIGRGADFVKTGVGALVSHSLETRGSYAWVHLFKGYVADFDREATFMPSHFENSLDIDDAKWDIEDAKMDLTRLGTAIRIASLFVEQATSFSKVCSILELLPETFQATSDLSSVFYAFVHDELREAKDGQTVQRIWSDCTELLNRAESDLHELLERIRVPFASKITKLVQRESYFRHMNSTLESVSALLKDRNLFPGGNVDCISSIIDRSISESTLDHSWALLMDIKAILDTDTLNVICIRYMERYARFYRQQSSSKNSFKKMRLILTKAVSCFGDLRPDCESTINAMVRRVWEFSLLEFGRECVIAIARNSFAEISTSLSASAIQDSTEFLQAQVHDALNAQLSSDTFLRVIIQITAHPSSSNSTIRCEHELCDIMISTILDVAKSSLNQPIREVLLSGDVSREHLWFKLFTSEGSCRSFMQHEFVVDIGSAAVQILEELEKQTATFATIEKLLASSRYGDDLFILLDLARSHDAKSPPKKQPSEIVIRNSVIEANAACKRFIATLGDLSYLFQNICTHATDLRDYMDDIEQVGEKLNSTRLCDAILSDKLKNLVPIGERLRPLRDSVAFRNVWEHQYPRSDVSIDSPDAELSTNIEQDTTSTKTVQHTVADLAAKCAETINELKRLADQFFTTPKNLAQMRFLFANIERDAVKREVATLHELCQATDSHRVIESCENHLSVLCRIPETFRVCEALCELYQVSRSLAQCIDGDGDDPVAGPFAVFKKFCEIAENEDSLMKDVTETESRVNDILSAHSFVMRSISLVLSEEGSDRMLKFLWNTDPSDLPKLTDAVEELGESLIRGSTIRDLTYIESSLVRPLKQAVLDSTGCTNSASSAAVFLRKFSDTCAKLNKAADAMVLNCVKHIHAIVSIHNGLTNRTEVTREKITRIAAHGKFQFEFQAPQQRYTVSCTVDGKAVPLHELLELRSKALLICSSDETADLRTGVEAAREIIGKINIAEDIISTLDELFLSGFPERFGQSTLVHEHSMKQFLDERKGQLQHWKAVLNDQYEQNHWLTFFYAQQFWTVERIFHCEWPIGASSPSDIRNALDLVTRVDPNVKDIISKEADETFRQRVTHGTDIPTSDPESRLHALGLCLANLFSLVQFRKLVPIPERIAAEHLGARRLDYVVHPGSVFVASSERHDTFNVIFALFAANGSYILSASNVLFCNPSTTMQELHAFLLRSFLHPAAKKPEGGQSPLYVVAGLEQLSFELRSLVIDELHAMQSLGTSFRLALLFCNPDEMQMMKGLTQAQSIRKLTGVEPTVAMELMAACRPNARVVTSKIPGLGKSEWIRQKSRASGKSTLKVSISGDISVPETIDRIKNAAGKTDQFSLHFDIASLLHPLEFDQFLFSLLCFGTAMSGESIIHIDQDLKCFIELSNTWNDDLQAQLPVVRLIQQVHFTPDNFIRSLVVESSLLSSIQVVCNYLDHLEKETVDSVDLDFESRSNVSLMTRERCQHLLQKYFVQPTIDEGDLPSFSSLTTFLHVLAEELRSLSVSPFFNAESIALMQLSHVRRHLVRALLDSALRFRMRSVSRSHSQQRLSLEKIRADPSLSSAMESMISWENARHVLIVFHSSRDSISTVFRERGHIPQSIQDLYHSQRAQLPNYSGLKHEELLAELKNVVGAPRLTSQNKGYVLTPDNFLKMLLILLRIRARVPVIISGETGCGKTSLIKYLASVVGAHLTCKNIHAGVTSEDIVATVADVVERANSNAGEDFWIFFDESNTCHSLGLFQEMICAKTYLGSPFPCNVHILSAVNPYRLRVEMQDGASVSTVGLKKQTHIQSNLAYRVNPLPEAMLDFVWDFGALSTTEELMYIRTMLGECPMLDKSVKAVSASQSFVRTVEDAASVSLRDVRRFTILRKFFERTLRQRKSDHHGSDNTKVRSMYLSARRQIRQMFASGYRSMSDCDIRLRSTVLALSHCYQCRLGTPELRRLYREQVCVHLMIGPSMFQKIVEKEQEDYLMRMEVPAGIAMNQALKENVFVLLVCILNKLPVFLVGKPGSSKTLSMQLIASNLRGEGSSDRFFRTLPQILTVSYQGSESSTSEGIVQVFERAERLLEGSKGDSSIIPTVVIDEIGLAEISRHNPLKALHSLLEPEEPKVAVVGISNWRLDASKMNRAIYLARPEPSIHDLRLTAQEIQKSFGTSNRYDTYLSSVARAYHRYMKQLSTEGLYPNFHGLRDFYSLVKYFSERTKQGSGVWDSSERMSIIFRGVERNFSGLAGSAEKFMKIFRCECMTTVGYRHAETPALDLIVENMEDENSRHMMIISDDESALWILDRKLSFLQHQQPVILHGSQFDDDLNGEEYNYRMLNIIIACMETGKILVLSRMTNIYGSLYDLLNQNYTYVGKKKNCRIALGSNSNPMCFVHDDFRCIVLEDERSVASADPPLLNRFEKQLLRFSDVLNSSHLRIVNELHRWISDLVTIAGTPPLSLVSLIPAYTGDMLASLVALHTMDTTNSDNLSHSSDIIETCKRDILSVSSMELIVASSISVLAQRDPNEIQSLHHIYFEEQQHDCFQDYCVSAIHDARSRNSSLRSIMYTFSSIHTPVAHMLDDENRARLGHGIEIEKVGVFKSERDATHRLKAFFSANGPGFLVLQFDARSDAKHVSVMKFLVDEVSLRSESRDDKHVCLLIHVSHNDRLSGASVGVSMLSGWNQLTIDNLAGYEAHGMHLSQLLNRSTEDILLEPEMGPFKLENVVRGAIADSVMSITYVNEYSPDDKQKYADEAARISEHISRIIRGLNSNESIVQFLADEIRHTIKRADAPLIDWHEAICCDREIIYLSDDLVSKIHNFLRKCIVPSLRSIVLFSEKQHSTRCLFDRNGSICDDSLLEMWMKEIRSQREKIIVHVTQDARVVPIWGILYPFFPFKFERVLDSRSIYESLVLQEITHQPMRAHDDTMTERAHEMRDTIVPREVIDHCDRLMRLPAGSHRSAIMCSIEVLICSTWGKREPRSIEFVRGFASHFVNTAREPASLLVLFLWHNEKTINDLLDLVDICSPLFTVQELLESTGAAGDNSTWTQQAIGSHLANLFDYIIPKLVPTLENVKALGGVGKWSDLMLNVLARVEELCNETQPRFKSWLKIWIECALAFVQNSGIASPDDLGTASKSSDLLFVLGGSCAERHKQSGHFPSPSDVLDRVLEATENDTTCVRTQRFKALFLEHCVESGAELGIIKKVVDEIAGSKNLCQFSARAIDKIISIAGLSQTRSVRICIREDLQSVIERVIMLHGIESSFSALLCDVMRSRIQQDLYHNVEHANILEWNMIEFTHTVRTINCYLRQGTEDADDDDEKIELVRVVYSIASVRAFLDVYAKALFESAICSSADIDTNVHDVINGFLGDLEQPRISAFRFYVLKAIRKVSGLSISAIKALPLKQRGASWIDAEQLISSQDDTSTGPPSNPLCTYSSEKYIYVHEALLKLISLQETSDMEALFRSAREDPEMRLCILNCFAFNLYVTAWSSGIGPGQYVIDWLTIAEGATLLCQNFGEAFARTVRSYVENFKDSPVGSVLRLSTSTSEQDIQRVYMMIHTFNISAANWERDWPISILAKAPSLNQRGIKVAETYVVGMEEDEMAGIYRALSHEGRVSVYECLCGYRYAIGNCGNPSAIGSCPSCKRQIGGANHILIQGRRVDSELRDGSNIVIAKGYIIRDPKYANAHRTVRALTAPSLHMLLHVMHITMYMAAMCGVESADQMVAGITGSCVARLLGGISSSQYLLEHANANVKALRSFTGCNTDDFSAMVHAKLVRLSAFVIGDTQSSGGSVIMTEDLRRRWEEEFSKNVMEASLQNLRRTITKFRQQVNDTCKKTGQLVSVVDQLLDETVVVAVSDEQTRSHSSPQLFLSRMLRTVQEHSYHGMRSKFLASEEHMRNHPFLTLVFERSDELAELHVLYPIVRWTNFVMSKCNHVLSRAEAAQKTIGQFIAEQEEKLDPEDFVKGKSFARVMFDEFSASWKTIADRCTRFNCRTLSVLSEINTDCMLSLCLPDDRDAGVYMIVAMMHLANLQNTFIEEARHIASNAHTLHVLVSSPVRKPVQRALLNDIALFDMKKFSRTGSTGGMQQYASSSLEYGRGEHLTYDFEKIEFELVLELLVGKKFLNSDASAIEKVQYQSEILRDNMNLHAEVASRVHQKILSTEEVASIQNSLENASLGTFREVLSSLEAAMKLLRHMDEVPETTVGELCSMWNETRTASRKLLKNPDMCSVSISSIVDLYCLCEDSMFLSVENLLPAAYKEPLTQEQADELNTFLRERTQLIPRDTEQEEQKQKQRAAADAVGSPPAATSAAASILESILMTVIRRFVMRYSLYGNADPRHPLAFYLQCDSLWPALTAPEDFEDIFPQSILNGQAYSLYLHLTQRQ